MSGDDPMLLGVVEGYYGRCWAHEDRLVYADYLARCGLNTFIYCPKADPFLRRRWMEDWPREQWDRLYQLAGHYRHRGLFWGVGLSPFALYRDYGTDQRRLLANKVARLAELSCPLLAILFDDMPGNVKSLAGRQAAIVADVCAGLPATRILMCPTYYSFDPVLERHFGTMPSGYWEELGRELPPQVDVFWTGERVCSERISEADVQAITSRLGRPVVLWDNYPVNDGAVRSQFLYCRPLSAREPVKAGHLRGHLCNPMNQALLSLPALTGLAALHTGAGPGDAWLGEVLGEATWRKLKADRPVFQDAGLPGLGDARREQLAAEYAALPGRAAAEVAGWLRGEYRFDPACLTD